MSCSTGKINGCELLQPDEEAVKDDGVNPPRSPGLTPLGVIVAEFQMS